MKDVFPTLLDPVACSDTATLLERFNLSFVNTQSGLSLRSSFQALLCPSRCHPLSTGQRYQVVVRHVRLSMIINKLNMTNDTSSQFETKRNPLMMSEVQENGLNEAHAFLPSITTCLSIRWLNVVRGRAEGEAASQGIHHMVSF
jgi:hypothetical protein